VSRLDYLFASFSGLLSVTGVVTLKGGVSGDAEGCHLVMVMELCSDGRFVVRMREFGVLMNKQWK